MVNMDPAIGHEIGKRRPALVVSNNENNEFSATVTVLPLSGQPAKRKYRHEVIIPSAEAGLSSTSRVKSNQIRTLDKSRLVRLIGALHEKFHSEVNEVLRYHLNMR